MSRHRRLIAALTLLACTAHAQDALDRSQRALQIIADFAKQMCADPEYKGSASSVAAAAKAKAEVSKLVKNLADAKVELSADARRDTFQGMLRTDLLQATRDASNCRLAIFNDLKDRLLPGKGTTKQIEQPLAEVPKKIEKTPEQTGKRPIPAKPQPSKKPDPSSQTGQNGQTKPEPIVPATLQETESWLKANFSRIKLVSCSRILEEGDSKTDWTVSAWSPRQVSYEINPFDLLLVNCVEGPCVATHQCSEAYATSSDEATRAKVYGACGQIESSKGSKWRSDTTHGSWVSPDGGHQQLPKALNALLRHQELCGGRIRSKF